MTPKIKKDKIVIDGKTFQLDEAEKLVEKLLKQIAILSRKLYENVDI